MYTTNAKSLSNRYVNVFIKNGMYTTCKIKAKERLRIYFNVAALDKSQVKRRFLPETPQSISLT